MTAGADPRLRQLVGDALVADRVVPEGRVHAVTGIGIEVDGLAAGIGELCTIDATEPLVCEVVGFHDGRAVVMPFGDLRGVRPRAAVRGSGEALALPVGDDLLGRVIDPLGRPLDGGPPLLGPRRPIRGAPPPALSRPSIDRVFETGVPVLDGLLTLGRGQRIGIFAGSGVGKSTLLGSIARGGAADVNVVALIGERGREVRDYIDEVLGPEGLARSVVVVATADSAPMLRLVGPHSALAIAEWFRDRGAHVLFTCDSVTRFANAAREVGLAAGEPPALRGYPPSLFAELPRLVERLGTAATGSITGLLTVLVEGDDLDEPVADALRGHLDGHVVLDRQIAARGRYPAVDVLRSVSRLMPRLATPGHSAAATELRAMLARYEDARDLVQVGAYKRGADPRLDAILDRLPRIEAFLAGDVGETDPRGGLGATLRRLEELAGTGGSSTSAAFGADR